LRKIVSLVSLWILPFLIIITQASEVLANTSYFEEIDIPVTIDEDCSAHFTERWVGHIYEGMEIYLEKENLGESAIENFTVTENGTTFEFLDTWDINSIQQEKALKNGITETANGVELSWVIGEYGTHEYILEYTVTNFVKQLEDSQFVH